MLAELAVGHPGGAFLIGGERKRVDEHGTALVELDVVRAGVLQRHAFFQSQLLDAKGGQGRVFQLGKAPLVGIADEGHELRLEDPDSIIALGQIEGNLAMRDEQAFFGQEVIQA